MPPSYTDNKEKNMSKNKPNSCDMQLVNSLLPSFLSCTGLPLEFIYGGKSYSISKSDAKASYKIIDSNVRKTIVEAAIDENVVLTGEYTEYLDYPVCEWVFSFTNRGKRESKLLESPRISFAIASTDPTVTYGNGDNCNESGYTFFETALDEPLTLTPNDGTPCNGASPFVKVKTDCGYVRLAVGWPARWLLTAEKSDGKVNITLGQKRISTVILPGETIRTPSITMLAHNGDDMRGINMWRRWYIDHVLPKDNGKPLSSMMCLHYWMAEGKPEFTAATEENQLTAFDSYLKHGLHPDVWWIDAGWYPCNYEWWNVGTWKHDTERFPRGLAPIGEKCRSDGTKLLLWFEPERVRPGSELWNDHPEWLLGFEKDTNKLLDLGNKEALNWIIERVDSLIKEYKVDIYRQDFNFTPHLIWDSNEPEDRIGSLENGHVQGYLKFWDTLLFRNPGLIIDTCAGGGRRNEMETLRRAIPLHYTDVGYGNHPIKQKQHRMMFEWIPYFRAHTMSWDQPDGTYQNTDMRETDEFSFHCALAPSVTVMTKYDADDSEFEAVKGFEPVWRRTTEYMLGGDYYPLTECNGDSSDWYAMRFEDSENRRGFIQVIRNINAKEDSITIDLRMPKEVQSMTTEGARTGETRVLVRDQIENFKVELPKRSGKIWYYTY